MVKGNRFILWLSIATLLLHQGNLERLCDSEDDVLCEREDSGDGLILTRAERHTPGFCPEGWYTFDDMCYKGFGSIPTERRNWATADNACRALNSNLVAIHSEEEQEFLKVLLLETRHDTWIGLHRSSSGNSEFTWKDSSSSVEFTNWAEGEPNDKHSEEDCVHMHYSRSGAGEWNDASCGNTLAYICQRTKDPALTKPAPYPSLCSEPQGWLKMGRSCYKVIEKTESTAPWRRAQSLCVSYGGNLVNVNGWAVTALLRFHLDGLHGPFWTGIKSTENDKFTWLGEHPLVYSNWQSDQPEELDDQQACVATDTEGEWMTRDCDERHPFICEVSPDVTNPTIEDFHPNMTCPYTSPKWHDLGGEYCYIINVGAKLKWDEALYRCVEEGGSLASFHSSDEVYVIQHYVKHHETPLYIGFRRDDEGRFVWSDESVADFYNWNHEEPNSLLEECAEMKTDTGKWNDVHCSNRYGYICSALKVPKGNETKTVKSTRARKVNRKEERLGAASITLIVMWILIAIAASAAALYYFRRSARRKSVDSPTYGGLKYKAMSDQ